VRVAQGIQRLSNDQCFEGAQRTDNDIYDEREMPTYPGKGSEAVVKPPEMAFRVRTVSF
jgi:hypothetical protein